MANLCIDIGNTRIKIGVFEDRNLVFHTVFYTMKDQEVSNLLKNHHIDKAISSSTRKSLTAFEKRIKKRIPLVRLNEKTPVPIINTYNTPETLGKDRLAAVVGCTKLFPDKTCLVIDAGTCITYDLITADKKYLGGNISPGLHMRARAMHDFTSALPKVKISYHEDYLGKSTIHAIQNGILWGTKLEIESFIALIKRDFEKINVIITGGDAHIFENLINSKIFAHSFLVLEGLDEIINHHAE